MVDRPEKQHSAARPRPLPRTRPRRLQLDAVSERRSRNLLSLSPLLRDVETTARTAGPCGPRDAELLIGQCRVAWITKRWSRKSTGPASIVSFDARVYPVACRVRMVASPHSRNATTSACHLAFAGRLTM